MVKLNKQLILEVYDRYTDNLISYKNHTQSELIKVITRHEKRINDTKYLENQLDYLKNKNKNKQKPEKRHVMEFSGSEKDRGVDAYKNYSRVDKTLIESIFDKKKLNQIGTGYTSIVYQHPLDSKKVLGFTVDTYKLKWLEFNKNLFKFELIYTIKTINNQNIYMYSMLKVDKMFDKIPSDRKSKVYDQVLVPASRIQEKVGRYNFKKKELKLVIDHTTDNELKSILLDVYKVADNDAVIDLHSGQWGYSNRIILFDPIINWKSVNLLKGANALDWNLKFKSIIDKISNKHKPLLEVLIKKT